MTKLNKLEKIHQAIQEAMNGNNTDLEESIGLVEEIRQVEIDKRLEHFRSEIKAERLSYGELAELQGLAEYIDPSDILLLEWAGVPESEV